MPDPELESQTVPDLLSFDGANEAEPVPLGDGAINGQGAKMQALSDSLAGFDALGEPMSSPADVQASQEASLGQDATEHTLGANPLGVAQTV